MKNLLFILFCSLLLQNIETLAAGESGMFASGDTDTLAWTIHPDGTLRIGGTGVMPDYDYYSSPWNPYRSTITRVIIDNGVRSIGNDAFFNCYKLTSVTIPASVTCIGNYAFGNCNSLTSVAIPASVAHIGEEAFARCNHLVEISVDADNKAYTTVGGALVRRKPATPPCPSTEIEKFELAGTRQIIEREGDRLTVYVPYETAITSMTTHITLSDGATVSPASGGNQDFTSPQTYTVTASNGATSNYVVTVKRSPWRNVIKNGEAPFLEADCHNLIVFKDKMWLLGGWLGNLNHDKANYVNRGDYMSCQVWSTSDGIHWESKGDAPWSGRHINCVVYNEKLWVIGGDSDKDNDVWNTADGINWVRISDRVPWGLRYLPYVVSAQGRIWVIGGQRDAYNGNLYGEKCNDVWSTTDGINWTREIQFARWAPRGLIHGRAVLDDVIYLMGGSAHYSAVYNDVWAYHGDGIQWSLKALHAPWKPRYWHTVASFDQKIWLIAGDVDNGGVNFRRDWRSLSNEVWYSSDGASWTQQKGVFWEPRHAAAAVEFKNQLWLVGGITYHPESSNNGREVTNEVWVMDLNYK